MKTWMLISKYCVENELVINSKKGKTKIMLFCSAKRLKSHGKELKITYQNSIINFVTRYKYLGMIVDSTLTLNENFDRN